MRKIPAPSSDLDRLFRHGDRTGSTDDSLLDFGVSVNPLGPPRSLVKALFPTLLTNIRRYPDPDCRALTERLARHHAVDPAQIVVGNGANDLIFALARALQPRRAAIVEPTYTEYLHASRLAGATTEHWLPEDDHFLPGAFDPQGADLVWLCNPNNPTGRLWPAGMLRDWVEAHSQTLFIVDEAFLPFRADEADHSLIAALDRLSNLVVLRSLTKIYTLPGLRLGYAVSSPALAQRLRTQVVPWSVNALAQAAGVAALEDATFLPRTHAWFAVSQRPFVQQLAACSTCLQPLPSEANFVLLRLKGVTAGWLTERLAKSSIAVRDASNFIGLDQHHVRVALRTPEENHFLLQELHQLSLEG